MRLVNSQRGSSKCGGVGVEGNISASVMWVWNLTASAPASPAASISRSAWRIEPSWLLPISAMTNTRGPRGFPAICTAVTVPPPGRRSAASSRPSRRRRASSAASARPRGRSPGRARRGPDRCAGRPRPSTTAPRDGTRTRPARARSRRRRRLEERDAVDVAADPLDQQRPRALAVDRPVGRPRAHLRHRPRQQRVARDGADHGVRHPARVEQAEETGHAVEQRVDRLQALEVGIDVDAAVAVEQLEPEDVGALGGLAEEVRRLAQLEVGGHVGLGPEPVLPVGVVLAPGLALGRVGELGLAEPDLVEDPGDHARSPRSTRNCANARSSAVSMSNDRPGGIS